MTYAAKPKCLNDKVILITGAGDGIGKTAALSYAKHGATVLLLGKTTSKLEALYDECLLENYPEPGIIPMDLASASADDMQALAEIILENYGRLDGILYNAAILGDRVPFERYDMNTWMKVMQVNFNSVCLLSRILLPLAHRAPSASIVFTSSSVGAVPKAYWGAYSVSKYALEGFAKFLADELENTSNIRINILNPGATRTHMRAAALPNEDPESVKPASDLMNLYLYLMNDDSQGEKGQLFSNDWLTKR